MNNHQDESAIRSWLLALLPGGKFDPAAWPWLPFREGIEQALLYQDAAGVARAALLRYSPGARVPRHRHTDYEYILLLEGAQQDERGRYEAGTLMINPPGSEHSVSSPEGCVVLALWQAPILLLE